MWPHPFRPSNCNSQCQYLAACVMKLKRTHLLDVIDSRQNDICSQVYLGMCAGQNCPKDGEFPGLFYPAKSNTTSGHHGWTSLSAASYGKHGWILADIPQHETALVITGVSLLCIKNTSLGARHDTLEMIPLWDTIASEFVLSPSLRSIIDVSTVNPKNTWIDTYRSFCETGPLGLGFEFCCTSFAFTRKIHIQHGRHKPWEQWH